MAASPLWGLGNPFFFWEACCYCLLLCVLPINCPHSLLSSVSLVFFHIQQSTAHIPTQCYNWQKLSRSSLPFFDGAKPSYCYTVHDFLPFFTQGAFLAWPTRHLGPGLAWFWQCSGDTWQFLISQFTSRLEVAHPVILTPTKKAARHPSCLSE